MEKIKLFKSNEMPEDIRDMLTEYYKNTGHRPILNNSYSKYPYLFEWENDEEKTPLDKYFMSKASKTDTFIIIHWEW